jgi:hypothetical protein
MRLFLIPRLRIRAILALIAIVAVLLALVRSTPRSKLRISRLRHAGGWSVAPQATPKTERMPAGKVPSG